mmetsp:Transcript_12133/g.35203  ORF Transcript_12133/g.35203 Transcript_12133/m.35203 type:complete len:81 (-) Transcript_12133:3188-3430(-)
MAWLHAFLPNMKPCPARHNTTLLSAPMRRRNAPTTSKNVQLHQPYNAMQIFRRNVDQRRPSIPSSVGSRTMAVALHERTW